MVTRDERSPGGVSRSFPMVTLPVQTLFQMTEMQTHEDLMAAGKLCEFDEEMGNAMFVSHQWVTSEHPDPEMEQLGVLQQALQNLLAGRSQVSRAPAEELWMSRLRCPTMSDFNARALYLWYDYFSCPQGTSPQAALNQRLAIDCIPSYVARSFFFVILCPSVHGVDGRSLNYSTWEARGWCRLEYMARQLAREDGSIICIKTPHHQALAVDLHGVLKAPGTGEFSFEGDRAKVGRVVLQMVWQKLQSLLNSGDLHSYRLLLNLHRFHLQGFGLEPIQSLVSGFDTKIDPSVDSTGFVAARFLHDNLFKTVSDRDAAGWSPLCYAAVAGSAALVEALLQTRADANDCTTKLTRSANLSKRLPVLSLAATYHSNDVMGLLLSARAKVNARCSYWGTALSSAAGGDNPSAVSLLLEARANPHLRGVPSVTPFRTTCVLGSARAMKEMLRINMPGISLRFSLHTALAFFGDSSTISCLIEASADVNEQLHVPVARMEWWGLLKMLHAAHYVRPSTLTTLAYHHHGATPLIFAILTSKFECISILLAAGARLDIPNARGKTGADFLQEMQVPVAWTEGAAVIKLTSYTWKFGPTQSLHSALSAEDSDDTIAI